MTGERNSLKLDAYATTATTSPSGHNNASFNIDIRSIGRRGRRVRSALVWPGDGRGGGNTLSALIGQSENSQRTCNASKQACGRNQLFEPRR
jgi:hypothetical protein